MFLQMQHVAATTNGIFVMRNVGQIIYNGKCTNVCCKHNDTMQQFRSKKPVAVCPDPGSEEGL